MVPNAPKENETHQNMSLGSYGVDRVDLLQKIQMHLCGTNFCINCTSSAHFAPSFVQQEMIPNPSRHYEMHQNMSLGSDGVDRVDLLQKF